MTTIGVLRSCADVIERARDRLVAGLLADDDLDQRHLLDRREEMDADELLRPLRCLGQARDRQRRGVAREHRRRRDHRLGLRGDVGLDLALLEHGLDHEVGAVEPRVVDGRRDAREHGLGLLLRAPALLDVLAPAASRNRPCPSRPARCVESISTTSMPAMAET